MTTASHGSAAAAADAAAPDFDACYAAARAQLGQGDGWHIGPVLRKDFQRFAFAIGDLNPLYFDEAAARAAGHPGLIAPPLYLGSVMGWPPGPREDTLRGDGLAELDLLPIVLPGIRLMGGGQQIEFAAPVPEHTDVTMRRELVDVQRRQGRSGELLLFTVRREYRDAAGRLLVRCTETFIGR